MREALRDPTFYAQTGHILIALAAFTTFYLGLKWTSPTRWDWVRVYILAFVGWLCETHVFQSDYMLGPSDYWARGTISIAGAIGTLVLPYYIAWALKWLWVSPFDGPRHGTRSSG
jgi:hypothetical protein